MRPMTTPPPSSHCEKCRGEMQLKKVEVAEGGLDLEREIFVCANCGHEQLLTVCHDRKTPHPKIA